jgi:hypothetical protein
VSDKSDYQTITIKKYYQLIPSYSLVIIHAHQRHHFPRKLYRSTQKTVCSFIGYGVVGRENGNPQVLV